MASNVNVEPQLILNAQQFQEALRQAHCRVYKLGTDPQVSKLRRALYSRIGVK